MTDYAALAKAALDRYIMREDEQSEQLGAIESALGPCIVQIHRASGSPTVRFGPFATIADASDWLGARSLSGTIVLLSSPDVDTQVGAEVWR